MERYSFLSNFNNLKSKYPGIDIKFSLRSVHDEGKTVASIRFEINGLEYGENLVNPDGDENLGCLIDIADQAIEQILNKTVPKMDNP